MTPKLYESAFVFSNISTSLEPICSEHNTSGADHALAPLY